MASGRTPNRTPSRLTGDALATVMQGMDLERRSSHQSLRPQTPVSLVRDRDMVIVSNVAYRRSQISLSLSVMRSWSSSDASELRSRRRIG